MCLVQPAIASDRVSLQRPAHRAHGVKTIGTNNDKTCLYTEVCITTPHGQLVAKAALPCTLLGASFSSQLSNHEISLLVVFNAGLPAHLKTGTPKGFRVMHLVGFPTKLAAAQKIIELSKDCKFDAEWMKGNLCNSMSLLHSCIPTRPRGLQKTGKPSSLRIAFSLRRRAGESSSLRTTNSTMKETCRVDFLHLSLFPGFP